LPCAIALRADWQQQLRRCRSELGFRYVRFHGLLSEKRVIHEQHHDAGVVTRDPRHSIMNQRVRVHLAQAPEPSGAWVERIDEDHANAKRRWQAFGAPEYLDSATPEQLHQASSVTRQASAWTWRDKRIGLELELPPHAVATLTVELVPA